MQYLTKPRGRGYSLRMTTPEVLVGTENPWTGEKFGREIKLGLTTRKHTEAVRLAGASVASFAIKDYARLIRDAAVRRHSLEILQTAQSALIGGEKATGDIMADLEAALVSSA